MPTHNIEVGKRGEDFAELYLRACGYSLIERRCRSRWGEIDLIMRQGEEIVFVEVKTRKTCLFGRPEAAVDWRKQLRLGRLAAAYLGRRDWYGVSARFDVVAIEGRSLRHVKDAFRPSWA